MTDVTHLSMLLSDARAYIRKAHSIPETWSEPMEHTAESIKELGIQHYGRGGEDMPERIVEAQVRAMAKLTYAYAELAYECDEDELSFFDSTQREKFDKHMDGAHDAAMKALREVDE